MQSTIPCAMVSMTSAMRQYFGRSSLASWNRFESRHFASWISDISNKDCLATAAQDSYARVSYVYNADRQSNMRSVQKEGLVTKYNDPEVSNYFEF
jgi:hypothetical protein